MLFIEEDFYARVGLKIEGETKIKEDQLILNQETEKLDANQNC